MRKILGLAVLAWLLPSTNAWSEAEFPYLEAKLVETSRLRSPTEQRLTAQHKRDAKQASSFVFTETFNPPPCTGRICPMIAMPSWMKIRTFKVVRAHQAGCAFRYSARDDSGVLTVDDYTDTPCMFVRKVPGWAVTLSDRRQKPRTFEGDPEPVRVAEDCSDRLGSWICPMVYLPVVCFVSTIDAGQVPIDPITAKGGNSCQAEGILKSEACVRGIDPMRIHDSDIQCKPVLDGDPVFDPVP